MGWAKFLVFGHEAIEYEQYHEHTVVGDDCFDGRELAIILDIHEHAEQCDSWYAVAGIFHEQAGHVSQCEGPFFISVPEIQNELNSV